MNELHGLAHELLATVKELARNATKIKTERDGYERETLRLHHEGDYDEATRLLRLVRMNLPKEIYPDTLSALRTRASSDSTI